MAKTIDFNKVTQFTFKTEHPTGRYKSFFPSTHLIKVKRYDVGRISDTKPYSVYLNIVKKDINEDKHPNCPWRTICLKKKFESIEEAKEFLNERIKDIFNQWTLFIDYEQK